MSDPLDDANDAALDLLRLYEALGVPALLVTLHEGAIYVRCQDAADVLPLCQRVVEEHEAPGDRTLQ
jgi:hypothetical protein